MQAVNKQADVLCGQCVVLRVSSLQPEKRQYGQDRDKHMRSSPELFCGAVSRCPSAVKPHSGFDYAVEQIVLASEHSLWH